jgi:selenocysteine lyase/cysteine desulfurase
MAIHGLLRPGDHVVTTVVEHNSVLRPLHACREHIGIDVTYVGCNDEGVIDPDDMQRALRPETRLVVVLHASNVTGAIQPVAEVAGRMQGHAALLLLDAAQSLGHLPTAMADLGCDLLAAPGHKGLLGPLGTGILALGPRAVDRVASTRQGGTGTRSETDEQPDSLPDRLESGNHNVPGILGLGAGVAYLRERGLDALRRHEVELTQKLVEGLAETSGVTVYGPRQSDRRVGVVSVSIEGYDSQEAAALLDAAYGIEVRAGLHCAPRLHRALGTLERGGALRLSLSCFNTAEDVAAAIAAIREITTHSLAG